MNTNEQLIEQFSYFVAYVDSLRLTDDEKWTAPIAEGKWSVRDIVAHMMLWDRYFLEGAIQPIADQKEITTSELDFDEFNKRAVDYAKTKSKEEIIGEAIKYRREILSLLKSFTNENFMKAHEDADGNPFTIHQYVNDFIWHDQHHIGQMKNVMSN